jgi:hypothetical protein
MANCSSSGDCTLEIFQLLFQIHPVSERTAGPNTSGVGPDQGLNKRMRRGRVFRRHTWASRNQFPPGSPSDIHLITKGYEIATLALSIVDIKISTERGFKRFGENCPHRKTILCKRIFFLMLRN